MALPCKSCAAVLLFINMAVVSTGDHRLIQTPEDDTVLLGTASYFACSTYGSDINWLVNSSAIESFPDDIRKDIKIEYEQNSLGHRFSTLKINGTSKYNGTKVQCFVEDGDHSNFATMYVQGILSRVINVTIQESEGSFLIFWAAPFSLIPHEIWYNISLFNLTNRREIDCTECTKITSTNYTFTPDNYDICYEYNIRITPINQVGAGEMSQDFFGNSSNSCSGNDTEGGIPRESSNSCAPNVRILAVLIVGGTLLLLFCGIISLAACLYIRKQNMWKNVYNVEVGGQPVHAQVNTACGEESQRGEKTGQVAEEEKGSQEQEEDDSTGQGSDAHIEETTNRADEAVNVGEPTTERISAINIHSSRVTHSGGESQDNEQRVVCAACEESDSNIECGITLHVSSETAPVVAIPSATDCHGENEECLTSSESARHKRSRSQRKTHTSRACEELEDPSKDSHDVSIQAFTSC